MRQAVLTKTLLVASFMCFPILSNAQSATQLKTGDNELEKGSLYVFPASTENTRAAVNCEQIYYLPDFFEKDGNAYRFKGESGLYSIGIYKKDFGYGDKNYYLQIWPRDQYASGDDDIYAHLEKDFGAIWVSGQGAGLPSYQNYNAPWNAWDTFAMTQTNPKVFEMTLTLGKELGPDAAVKFWFYNFSQSRYRRSSDNRAEYGIPDGSGNWDRASHEYEFRGNQWNNDDFVPLLKMANCDFLEVSKHTAAHDALGGSAALPQYGNGNMGGIAVGNYSDLPKLPSSTDKHTYKYKFTINLEGVNDIKQDHKGDPNFAYGITIENKGDVYGLTNYQVNNYDALTLDTEDQGGKHAISLRDAMRFQGGVLYADHFNKKFNRLAITGYLNQSQDIAFLKDIAKNVKVLDLSGVTNIEGNQIPADFSKDNSTLEELYLPASLQTIGENAFAGCTNLKKVYVKSENAAKGAASSAFSGINANQCELVFENDVDGNAYRNGGWMNILTKDIYENPDREEAKNYNVCHQANADVRLHRKFTGKWETIVLPFDLTDKNQFHTKEGHIDHASYFYDYKGNSASGALFFINIHHETTDASQYDLNAGHPFLLRVKDEYINSEEHTFENVETKAILPAIIPSTKNGMSFTGTFDATATGKKLNDIFALKDGKFYHANNASMKGYRGWFQKEGITQAAKTLSLADFDNENTTTAIIGIGEDGSMQEAFDIYNLNGQLIKKIAFTTQGLPSGVYIVNHKKVIVK